jgi:hypothetical protein
LYNPIIIIIMMVMMMTSNLGISCNPHTWLWPTITPNLGQGFWQLILWCSQTGNHVQEHLAKFGYRPDTKVKNLKNSSHCLLQTRTQYKLWQFL